MSPEEKSPKTPSDPDEALDQLSDAIDEMEAGVTSRAKETVSGMSPALKTGLAIGGLALGAGAVIFALRRRESDEEPERECPICEQIGPQARDAIALAAGKAIKAGFAALARRVSNQPCAD